VNNNHFTVFEAAYPGPTFEHFVIDGDSIGNGRELLEAFISLVQNTQIVLEVDGVYEEHECFDVDILDPYDDGADIGLVVHIVEVLEDFVRVFRRILTLILVDILYHLDDAFTCQPLGFEVIEIQPLLNNLSRVKQ